MFKLVALDVDGTLLNSHHALMPAVAEAVKAAQAQGVHIVLATGKQYSAILPLIEQLELTAPQVTSHGALVTDPIQNTILHQQCIPLEPGDCHRWGTGRHDGCSRAWQDLRCRPQRRH